MEGGNSAGNAEASDAAAPPAHGDGVTKPSGVAATCMPAPVGALAAVVVEVWGRSA